MESKVGKGGQRIFFGSQRFVTGKEGVQVSFDEGDFVYARVLLDKPLSHYADGDVVSLDVFYRSEEDEGETPHFVKVQVPERDMGKMTLDFDLLPEKPQTVFADFASAPALIEMVMNQADAEVSMHFRFVLGDLEGSFSYTKRSDESFCQWADRVRTNSVAITKDFEASNTFLPEVFDRPSEAFDDPMLSTEFIVDYFSKRIEIKKLVIGPGPDYVTLHNILGEIIALKTKRYIMIAYKSKSDGYCYFGNCTFYRAYLGNGTYGSPEISMDVTIDTRIDCANIQ